MSTKFESVFQKDNIGVGRRKRATARVFLVPGEGNIVINKIPGEKYLQYNVTYLNTIWAPLKEVNLDKQFDIVVIVKGGGLNRTSRSYSIRCCTLIM